ncbi:tetratricopeptide repeat protein [Actinomyces oris]|uniref:Tetratricopeptide repeat protein n=1 Tax=Actinomyces oris TaxID=544580 RepID=A0A508BGZ7_9ACTO|nr:FxSxx-COOH system tetratricopeptide repeat protein [Actinomyces oris]QQC40085.1 tetratricopeptide repeat protein [Actinomyces oris]TQD61109.1 tetratricopeptide repeat protein [Actinomyces oris]
MADPLSFAVLSMTTSLAGLVMRGAAVAVDPSWCSAASLPGEAVNTWRSIWTLMRGRGGEENPLEASIKARLQKQVDAASERYERTGVTRSALAGTVTEIEVALKELSGDDATVLEAVRFPDRFEMYLRRRTAGRRRYVETTAEPFFDDLTRIVADEFIRLTPGSRGFDIAAFNQLLAGRDQLVAGQNQLLKGQAETRERLDKIVDSINNTRNTPPQSQTTPKRIHFGSRPTVTANFVSRAVESQLFNAIITRAEPKTVLTGMRGTGKTQLAAAIATKCEKEDWPLVAWINAASRKELVADLYELATRISTDTPKSTRPDIAIQRCLDAMSSADTTNRLFIFDNVDNFDDLKGLIPRGNGIRVILTTTRHLDWNSLGWSPIRVGTFQRDQSISILCERTDDTNRDAADQIAEVLGDLPVAVTQAATTARNERYTLSEYLDRLNSFPLATTIEKREGGNYPETVSTALWLACKTTVNIIKRKNPKQGRLAIQQISMLSLLAAPGVPIRWLEEDADRENAKKSLSALFNSSLCQTSTDNRKALIHRLQGRAFRENYLINEAEKEYILTSIIQTLENVVAHTSYNPPREREEMYDLIEQLSAIASQEYSQSLFTKPAMATILERTLRTALELGMYQAALTLVNSVAKASDTLGAGHPDILSSRKSLADAYLLEGQVEKAIALLEQNLKHSKTIPDTTHHNTQKLRNSFMSTLRAGGGINKVTTHHQQIQKDHPHTLGPDHTEIFASRNNLAGAYREAGRLDEAITLYQQNFVDTDYFLGPDHPYTLASRNNLANAYQEAGRLEDAITLYRQNLQDRTRLVGPNHPDTLATRNNLANAYRDAGKIEEAIPLLEQNLKDCIHILGPYHPHTLLSRNNLANAYQTAGRLDEAIPLLEQNLKDCIHILGPDNPDTLFTRDNFACAYQATGRLNEAITLLERNLKGCTRILGPHHPHTLNTRHRLADAYRTAGRIEEAEALFETPSDSEDDQDGTEEDPDQEAGD